MFYIMKTYILYNNLKNIFLESTIMVYSVNKYGK